MTRPNVRQAKLAWRRLFSLLDWSRSPSRPLSG